MAEYYLNTIFDDNLKKTNKKTYREMMFDAAELEWKNHHDKIHLEKKEKDYASNFLDSNNLKGKKIIGIHMGASPRWPSKVWHKKELIKFILLAKKKGYEIILFGGSNEIKEHSAILEELKNERISMHANNPNNTLLEFASLVNICDVMVCSDSLALHVALALKKPVVGLFFCTSPHEVEDYGLLRKLVSPRLEEFFPEKMDQYDEQLVQSISAEEVLENVKAILG